MSLGSEPVGGERIAVNLSHLRRPDPAMHSSVLGRSGDRHYNAPTCCRFNRMRITRLLLAALISAGLSSAQNLKFALRVDVDVVSVDVEVTDAGGKAVTTLTEDDFLLYEDGKPQEIRHFASVEAPYTILAMFDCTGSLSDQWEFLAAALLGFVRSLRSQDSIGIVAFGTNLISLRDWIPRNDLRLDF